MVFELYQEVNKGAVVWFYSHYILWRVDRGDWALRIIVEHGVWNRLVSRMYMENKIWQVSISQCQFVGSWRSVFGFGLTSYMWWMGCSFEDLYFLSKRWKVMSNFGNADEVLYFCRILVFWIVVIAAYGISLLLLLLLLFGISQNPQNSCLIVQAHHKTPAWKTLSLSLSFFIIKKMRKRLGHSGGLHKFVSCI